MYRKYLKRGCDLVVAILVLVLAFPVFLLVALLIRLGMNSSVFFFQDRVGKNTKVFKVIKFKTMKDEYDERGALLPDELRLTKIGRFVRSTSLDELPQLINVLRGDMSIVGPRPLLVKYLPLYNNFQNRRHEVRPGITGWAQVNGRNSISWSKKFELDVWYVDHVTFLVDLQIILMTIKRVFRKDGINSATNATMETFTGNE